MYKKYAPLLLLIFVFNACQNEKSSSKAIPIEDIQLANPISPNPPKGLYPFISIIHDQVQVRDQAGIDAKVIATLNKGDRVMDLGEISPFTTKIKWHNQQYDEHWIKIKTTKAKTGWIYGAAVNLTKEERKPALSKKERTIQELTEHFGKNNAQNILAYQQQYETISNSKDFAKAYEMGELIRDSLVQYLKKDKLSKLDFDWLRSHFPAYHAQLMDEEFGYYFFQDYPDMMEKALASKGIADEDFITILYHIHPIDSIEYFHPAWLMPTEKETYSRLGKGIHHQILKELEAFSSKNRLFQRKIRQIKRNILNDINSSTVIYWEGQKAILSELNSILSANYSILTAEEINALKKRQAAFKKPEKNNIQLNNKGDL